MSPKLFTVPEIDEERRKRLLGYLTSPVSLPSWTYGWKSKADTDSHGFWHRHYAGAQKPDHLMEQYDCAEELEDHPEIFALWSLLTAGELAGHTLVRCYANGMPYGCHGTVHTDAKAPDTYTTIYYPHEYWKLDWGGETVLFNRQGDIGLAVLPKPGRFLIFDGRIPHVARGVSRACPVLRITLMFKTTTAAPA